MLRRPVESAAFAVLAVVKSADERLSRESLRA